MKLFSFLPGRIMKKIEYICSFRFWLNCLLAVMLAFGASGVVESQDGPGCFRRFGRLEW